MDARVGMSNHSGVTVEEGARKYLQQQQTQQNQLQPVPQIGAVPNLLASGIAGAFSKTCTAPLARLTILFQVHGMHSDAVLSKPSIGKEAMRIVNEEGYRAFWKGNLVTVAHRIPYTSVNFYSYERYKTVFRSLFGIEERPVSGSGDILVHFFSGGLAGSTAATTTYPLDLVRTRLAAQRNQIYYGGIGHALSTICKDEGFFGLYKGLGATLLGVGPSIAISFSVYESLKSHWKAQRPGDSVVMVSLVCGSLSGMASSTATFPLDLVRRRMQLEGACGRARIYKKGLFSTFGQIMKSEGLRGLYRGILPEYYKVVPGVGIVFMTYEFLKKLMADLDS